MSDECFYVNVGLLMDRVEDLHELPLIHITGRDSDYYDDKFSGLYSMVQ